MAAKTSDVLRSVVRAAVCTMVLGGLMISPEYALRFAVAASPRAAVGQAENPEPMPMPTVTPTPDVGILPTEVPTPTPTPDVGILPTPMPSTTELPVIESTAPYSSPAGSGLWLTVAGKNLNTVNSARLLPSPTAEEGYYPMIAASAADYVWLWISDGLPVGLYTLELCTTNGQCMRQTDALEMYFGGVAVTYLWPSSVSEGERAEAVIYGRGLLPGVSVTIGGLPATDVQASGTWIVFSTPVDLPVGQHDVTVMLSDTSATYGGSFWVVSVDAGTATPDAPTPDAPTPTPTPMPTATPNSTEPPVIASTTPYSALARSGPWLQVTGRNLEAVSRVRLLPSAAEAEGYELYYIVSGFGDNMSIFVHNGVPAGRYALELCTTAGPCVTQPDAMLLYDGEVGINYVWPGSASEGSSVEMYISGQDFVPGVTVTIGGRPATALQVYNPTLMSVRTPADLPIGQHDVTVMLSRTSATMTGAFSVMGDAVDSIWPSRQVVGTSGEAYLYGYGFTEGMSVTIGGLPAQYLSASDAIMQIRTPAELPIGTYDVVVRYPDATITLPAAYEVIEEPRSDLYVLPDSLWTLPADVRQGEPVMLALTVYRQGGTATRDARVSFYVLDDAGVPQLTDVVSTTLLEPGMLWHSAGQASTTWVPNAAYSVVTLMAVVDAEGQTDDLDLTNNVVTRTITVQPSMADGAAPAIQSLTVNGGAQATAERMMTVTIDVSGTASMMYLIEREFDAATGVWTPANSTWGWIPYERNYPLTLMGASGLRYVQAWVSDEMGRISLNNGLARINYNAAPEEVARGQVRMFRYPLTAGRTATITLKTLRGDADLYVWNADGSMADRSVADSLGVDQVVVAANASGDYQIEVYGYEDSEYRLTVEYGARAQRPGAMRAAAATSKTLRSAPVVQPASLPSAVVALPGVPMNSEPLPTPTPDVGILPTPAPSNAEPPVIESTTPYSSPAGSGLWLTVAGRHLDGVNYARLLPSSAAGEGYDAMVAASTADSLWLWISDGLPVGLYTLELCTTTGQCTRQVDALEMYFGGVAVSYLWPSSVNEGERAEAVIYGRGLLPGVSVTIGGLPATNVQAYGTWIVFSTPVDLPIGQHDVTVMLSDTSSTIVGGLWVVSADAGTPTATPEVGIPPMPTPMPTPAPTATPNSTEPPVIASTTPYSAVARSGPWLQVTGRNLLQVSRVRLLPSEAGAEGYEVYFTASSATEMSVFVYNGVPAGRYALELCTAAGSCATQQDALLLYDGGVSIGYVWPGAVSAGSSADVYIYGRDLTPEVMVTIGGRPVTVVQVYNSSIMYVRTPADLPIGQHDVTAILSGTSSTMTGAFSVMGDAVEYIWPNRQITGTSAETYLYGYGFTEGMSVTIGGLPVPYLSVNSASIMQIRTPAELPLGTYDVVVRYPEAAITLPAAYEVIEERRSDWFALPEGLWTLPADARQGEPAMLALTVYRQGGAAPRDARVSFYVINDAGVPQLIDVVSTTPLEPGTLWHSSGQASTTWVPNAADSVVTLMAVIDAEGQTDDLDLTNNVVTRTITVQPSMADGAAPAIQSLTVNGGAEATAERAVTVTIDVSGTASMMYLIEREFNAAAGVWIPVHNTGWIRYERNYPLTLMGASGLRYVQAWVSDEMGRISSNSGLARINYNAAPEGIARGQVRMFRYPMTAGQAATITLETLRGDADLYVWHADGSVADRSAVDSVGVDQVVVAANASGDYQIEVYGYEDSEYRLTVEYGAGAQRPGAMRAAAATSKTLRSAPVVQPASQPAAVVALPVVPMDAETSPPVTPLLPGTPGSTQNIYLPMVVLP